MNEKQLVANAYHTLAARIERKSYLAIVAEWLREVWGLLSEETP